MLLTTPKLNEHISGAILYDETLRQSTKDGVPFAKVHDGQRHHPGHQGRQGHRSRWPASRAKWSPKASTACASA